MEITRQMEIDMITDESQWPGETLCLKKRPKPGERVRVMGYSHYGVLASSKLPLVVYLRPNFVEERHYATVDALLDDGWLVD